MTVCRAIPTLMSKSGLTHFCAKFRRSGAFVAHYDVQARTGSRFSAVNTSNAGVC